MMSQHCTALQLGQAPPPMKDDISLISASVFRSVKEGSPARARHMRTLSSGMPDGPARFFRKTSINNVLGIVLPMIQRGDERPVDRSF